MNSLQILSILSYDKVNELKDVLIPKFYYTLLYESVDANYITYNSKKLFVSETTLTNFFMLIVKYNSIENNFPSCCTFEEELWDENKVKEHFITTRHYKNDKTIYRMKEFEVCQFTFQ